MKKQFVTEDGIEYKKHVMSKKDKKNSVLYMLLSLIGVLVFFLLPFMVVIYYSVVDNPISHKFVGLDNFIRIIQNSSFLQAAKKHSNLFTGCCAACGYIIFGYGIDS
jgi:ABC-type sugar transport system permease subunit